MKFIKNTYLILLFTVLLGFNLVCFAASNSNNLKDILGYWHYFDKKTGKPSAILKIWNSKGKYFGRLVKVYHHDKKDNFTHCIKCSDSRHNKPVLGLIILRNMVWNEKKGYFGGGRILDARSGKEYRCHIRVVDNGKKLKMRGYLGVPILGRTVYWYRGKA